MLFRSAESWHGNHTQGRTRHHRRGRRAVLHRREVASGSPLEALACTPRPGRMSQSMTLSPRMGCRIFDARDVRDRRKLVAGELGARAIRMNRFDNEPFQAGKEHDEGETRQEEIYFAVARGGGVGARSGRSVRACGSANAAAVAVPRGAPRRSRLTARRGTGGRHSIRNVPSASVTGVRCHGRGAVVRG